MKRMLLVLLVLLLTIGSLATQSFSSHANIDDEFCGSSVIVILDKNIGGINRTHSRSFFEGIDIVEMRDLTVITGDVRSLRINEETFRQILLLRLPIDDKQNVLDVIERLRFVAGVEYAEPRYFLRIGSVIPNDPFFDELWGMEKIQMPQAWAFGTGSHDVKVGVIDSGMANHVDLDANLTSGWDFVNDISNTHDIYGHGTHVAGTIGAIGDNNVGVVGVNWNVTMVPLKIQLIGPFVCIVAAIEAITYATNHTIPILNFSVSGFGHTFSIRRAVINYPGLFVWSAGNDNVNLDLSASAPVFQIPNLISVGSTTFHDTRSFFSNFGEHTVNIFAPGSNILSTIPGDNYTQSDGTSMAAPHVTGVAALLMSVEPSLTAEIKKEIILHSADTITIMNRPALRLNAYNAMRFMTGTDIKYPPMLLSATAGNGFVDLTWREPFFNSNKSLLGYRVYRDGVVITETISELYFTDTGLTNGDLYRYQVTAIYSYPDGESQPSLRVFATPTDVLPRLSNLRYSLRSTIVTLEWEVEFCAINKLLGFLIYRNGVIVGQTELWSFRDFDVPLGVHEYQIIAMYQGGESASVLEVTVFDKDRPEGSGTESAPFQISSLENLRWMSESPVAWGDGIRLVYYIQTADIDASETRYWNDGAGFIPISNELHYDFVGHYDGNGYHIYGLHISPIDGSTFPSFVGMFTRLEGSLIQNLNLINLNINVGGDFDYQVSVGGIAGFISHSVIKNSVVSGNIKTDLSSWYVCVGGLAGMASSTEIHKTSVNVNISINGSGTLYSVGGITGTLASSIINNSYFAGNISIDGVISHLISGGLVGDTCERFSIIENAYVTSFNRMRNVQGGMSGRHVNISNSFWNTEATGITIGVGGGVNNPGVIGLTTAQMKQASTFIEKGWDFENIWDINPDVNNGFPFLRREKPPTSDYDIIVNRLENELHSNFPNPFNPYTTIQFSLSSGEGRGEGSTYVEIVIYNIRGQRVRTLLDGSKEFEAGRHTVIWDGRDNTGNQVSSGVYLYRMRAGEYQSVRRMVLMK